MNNKIVCLVGESGSGKSTISEFLEKEGYKNIKSYTTRKKRHKNEQGHIFTDVNIYKNHIVNGIVVGETCFDGNWYWTTKDQLQEDCVYVIDTVGVQYLKERIKDAEIIVIYLKTDRKVRMKRMLAERDPKSVVERLKHDKEVFKVIECDYVVDGNREVNEVLEAIKKILNKV